MYSCPNFYLVDNPINRYSVGDRTPGLVYGDDGSLTITISPTDPTDADEPRTGFPPRPASSADPAHVRAGAAVLDGTYVLPADHAPR